MTVGTELGPIEDVVPTIATRVAENLHADAEDTWLNSAIESAILFAADRTGHAATGLPADQLTVNGIVGFSTRLYLDALSPNGAQVAIADPEFAPIFQPENLWKHWRHYFARLYGYDPDADAPTGWGIA